MNGWVWKRRSEIGHRCERHYKRGIRRIGSRLDLRGKEELEEVTEDLSLCDRRMMVILTEVKKYRGSNWGKERARVEMSSVSDMPSMGLKTLREIAGEPMVPAIQ